MNDLSTRPSRARLALLLLAAACLASGCSSFGRKFNQAMPEFLRSDPGAEEIERYQKRVRVLNRSEAEAAEAKVAFAAAKGYFEGGEFSQAITNLEAYLEAYPDTKDDKEARFLLIKSYMAEEEGSDAREAIKDFVAFYPISSFSDRLEEVTWTLAHEFLEGKHDFLFFGKEGDGLALLKLITTAFPNGLYADEAQWELGNYYYDGDNYIEAMGAYSAIVERYPRSAWAPRALFNHGLCRIALAKGPVYDEVNMEKGVKIFAEYLKRYPEGDRRAEAEAYIKDLENLRCQKQIEVAKWYLGQDQPLAARYYLVRCIRNWEHTDAVADARELLAELPDVSEEAFFEGLRDTDIVDPDANEIPISDTSTKPDGDNR